MDSLHDASMLELFRTEVEMQVAILSHGLLALEREPQTAEMLAPMMRAAHSIKGAARIVQLEAAERLAHVLEDCFVAVQAGTLVLTSAHIEVLLHSVDLLSHLAQTSAKDMVQWLTTHASDLTACVAATTALLALETTVQESSRSGETADPASLAPPLPADTPAPSHVTGDHDRVIRVTADSIEQLMGLAGESLVQSRSLEPFLGALMQLKSCQQGVARVVEKLRHAVQPLDLPARVSAYLEQTQQQIDDCHHLLSDRVVDLEGLVRRSATIANRLYRDTLSIRMRPFADGVQGFPRMVRDTAKQLGKHVTLEIVGQTTQVDRDILAKLEAPLTHLLRNAIDHGIELPEERLAAGKAAEGKVRLMAGHRAGMLHMTVADDGRGVDVEHLRHLLVRTQRLTTEMAAALSDTELMDFLFLPGVSTAETVTEISGRGVGLDVVQRMVQEVGGVVQAVSQPGKGMRFDLQLPLTLSVLPVLLVDIAGDPYALPLSRVDRVLRVAKTDIAVLENRQYVTFEQQHIGLISAHQVLELPESPANADTLAVVVLSDRLNQYGLVVERFLGESDLVVKPLDPRLGKIPDIGAAALLPDGTPILIIDVDDLVRSMDALLSGGRVHKVGDAVGASGVATRKRILVVDDSITVREVERRLLANHGYEVDVAVDGMEGWNAVRVGHYTLVITDVDMPRMNGLELVTRIKTDVRLRTLPVMIVSYKDREEDRLRGLDAGANYYFTKSSFHDDALLQAVFELIGEP